MVRAPCCEKTGLKKGPWNAEEDRILTSFISLNGIPNWRALPQRAGLLRCGKSCRLRWMNYLRPDIKRGGFTQGEEEAIIELHQELGNKWSAIAASLPGRTDNEIKNVWHTHLKKRVAGKYQPVPQVVAGKVEYSCGFDRKVEAGSELGSPEQSLSEVTSVDSAGAGIEANGNVMEELLEKWPEMGESFWSEVFPAEEGSGSSDFSSGNSDPRLQFAESFVPDLKNMGDDGDFWRDVFNRADELTEFI